MNDSISDMMSVGGSSMAGLSDGSGGGVKKVGSGASDGSNSMYSGADVVVKRSGTNVNESTDDFNTSMAGLSDMSMGEINRAGGNRDDSMADFSMASLNEDSMANINDSYNKPIRKVDDDEMARVSEVSENTREDSDVGESGNMLDGLRQELGMPSLNNPP